MYTQQDEREDDLSYENLKTEGNYISRSQASFYYSDERCQSSEKPQQQNYNYQVLRLYPAFDPNKKPVQNPSQKHHRSYSNNLQGQMLQQNKKNWPQQQKPQKPNYEILLRNIKQKDTNKKVEISNVNMNRLDQKMKLLNQQYMNNMNNDNKNRKEITNGKGTSMIIQNGNKNLLSKPSNSKQFTNLYKVNTQQAKEKQQKLLISQSQQQYNNILSKKKQIIPVREQASEYLKGMNTERSHRKLLQQQQTNMDRKSIRSSDKLKALNVYNRRDSSNSSSKNKFQIRKVKQSLGSLYNVNVQEGKDINSVSINISNRYM